ncbi:MAG: leucine--tRNA ligase, partial [Planctomycetota bacterium]|nr:leucine--tRNA ligase [Planctomycetota bacterium]
MKPYDFASIEARWQKYWEENGSFRMDPSSSKPKYYALIMYPYPSGTLHVGHGRNYFLGDVVVRYKLMRGYNLLSPIGWDAFGLPAENAAIQGGVHPRESTLKHIRTMTKQLHGWGVGYDWTREVTTCEPDYYRWTQWIFLKIYEKGLAYRKKASANWCPSCATVLANEQVVDGACERCEATVETKDLDQWFFRITDYVDRLLDDLKGLSGWPERVRRMQENWIGRSEGVQLDFKVTETGEPISCFTTRVDTLYGVTFMAIAPEQPLVEKIARDHPREKEIREFVRRARMRSSIERTAEGVEKEGIPTDWSVENPISGENVPIFIADYVLPEYGTGAVMGVPAHDQRDFEFARAHELPMRVVIAPKGKTPEADKLEEAFLEDGVQVNSGPYDGIPNREAMQRIAADLEREGRGKQTVAYRLRDWCISRQRYWGAPIPIIYCDDCGVVPVPEGDLPVVLPLDVEFRSTGDNPLARHEAFTNATCPTCGKDARRETDTMDTFVDSSWYFLRYLSPKDENRVFDSEMVNRWHPVDQYIGGIEHAILHL